MIKQVLTMIMLVAQLSASAQTSKILLEQPPSLLQEADQNNSAIVCRFSYNNLVDSTEQEMYQLLLDSVTEYKYSIDVSSFHLSRTRIEVIAQAVASDNPDVFWFEGYIHCRDTYDIDKVYLSYNLTLAEVRQYADLMDERIKTQVDACKLTNDSLTQLHNAYYSVLCTNYSNTGNLVERTPVGTLINFSSLCAARTQTLAWIYHELGFETVYHLARMRDDTYHIWLMVNYNNEWYNIDPTIPERPFMFADGDIDDVAEYTDTLVIPESSHLVVR